VGGACQIAMHRTGISKREPPAPISSSHPRCRHRIATGLSAIGQMKQLRGGYLGAAASPIRAPRCPGSVVIVIIVNAEELEGGLDYVETLSSFMAGRARARGRNHRGVHLRHQSAPSALAAFARLDCMLGVVAGCRTPGYALALQRVANLCERHILNGRRQMWARETTAEPTGSSGRNRARASRSGGRRRWSRSHPSSASPLTAPALC